MVWAEVTFPRCDSYTTKRVGGGVQDFDAVKVMKFAVS
jgi:predicted phage gp36 major capsid-like protein